MHKQDTLENGDLGVLIYGDEGEGTLKRYIQRGNCVVLQPSTRPTANGHQGRGPEPSGTSPAAWWRPRRSGNNSLRLLTLFAATSLMEGGLGKTGNFPVLPKAPPPGELARRQP